MNEGMKNLQCDICSKQVQYKFQLYNLREIYQTENVVRVCEECNYIIDKQLQRKCWNRKIEIEDISKDLKDFIMKWKAWEKRFC